jgi:hypothetical protein
MFKKVAATISAVGFVMLAVALAPGVPTTSRLHSSPVPLSRLGFLIRLATACQEDCADEEASNPQLSRKSCVG